MNVLAFETCWAKNKASDISWSIFIRFKRFVFVCRMNDAKQNYLSRIRSLWKKLDSLFILVEWYACYRCVQEKYVEHRGKDKLLELAHRTVFARNRSATELETLTLVIAFKTTGKYQIPKSEFGTYFDCHALAAPYGQSIFWVWKCQTAFTSPIFTERYSH